MGILEDVTAAAYRKDPRPDLGSANDKLNRLRVLLRLAHELKVLAHDPYREAAERMAEAGRLLGGWLRRGRGHGGEPESAGV